MNQAQCQVNRLRRALEDNEAGTSLVNAIARLREPILVGEGDLWFYEGFISLFHSLHEAIRAVDPTVAGGLPAHCLSPEQIARFFRIPVHERPVLSSTTSPSPEVNSMADRVTSLSEDDFRYLTLAEAAKLIPGRHAGQRVSIPTMWRWCVRGVHNGIRLQSVLVGGRRCTTRRWVQNFIDAMTRASPIPAPDSMKLRTPSQRHRASERATEELRAAWKQSEIDAE
jgi:Protein of unknown function (DUF1580)